MSKTTMLVWVIVILVVLNITTVVTYHYIQRETSVEQESLLIMSEGKRLTGSQFRHILNFDNEQMDSFRKENRHFQPRFRHIIYRIDSLKSEMFTELQQADMDSVVLDSLAAQIGLLHADLKRETILFYKRIKAVCNQEQQSKLGTVFSPLFTAESAQGEVMERLGKHKRVKE